MCEMCLSYAYTNLYPYMLAEKCVKYEMCLTSENVKQNNVYVKRVCKLHCALNCVMMESEMSEMNIHVARMSLDKK